MSEQLGVILGSGMVNNICTIDQYSCSHVVLDYSDMINLLKPYESHIFLEGGDQ